MDKRQPPPKRYPAELKQRAVKMMLDLQRQDPNYYVVIRCMARQLGIGDESLHLWVKRAKFDDGVMRIDRRVSSSAPPAPSPSFQWACRCGLGSGGLVGGRAWVPCGLGRWTPLSQVIAVGAEELEPASGWGVTFLNGYLLSPSRI